MVIFGGNSTEHEISCKSVINIINNIDIYRYNIIIVGITKEGKWLLVKSIDSIIDNTWYRSGISAFLSPDATMQTLIILDSVNNINYQKIDIIFPVLHGKNGEDGTIQGLFELSKIPYVGCGVTSSSLSMDKIYTKIICKEILEKIGVKQAAYVYFSNDELYEPEKCSLVVEGKMKYPVFIKPSNAGSSCGISKATNREQLINGIINARIIDQRVIVEEYIDGREIECAVYKDGNGVIKTSKIGEIISSSDFYDYESKYSNLNSKIIISPELSSEEVSLVQSAAVSIFNAVDGFSLSRVDFFLSGNGLFFNEINTLPGFTDTSMYPILWRESGFTYQELIQLLIDSAYYRTLKY